MKKQSKYSPEIIERAVHMVSEAASEYSSQWAAIESIAAKIGCTPGTLRRWVRQQERDAGQRPGPLLPRSASRPLEREVRELRKANEILRLASAFFAEAELDRRFKPVRKFVDQYRHAYGVEPICRVMQVAPSGYWRYAAQQRNPELRCARARRDDVLSVDIERVWQANMQVYGADKGWRQLRREGTDVARCTVERLMRKAGLRGVMRGRVVRTTVTDAKAPCPLDRVNRQFKAQRPNQLWVSDFAYVSTWQGFVYVAFVIDVFCPAHRRLARQQLDAN